MSIFTNIQHVIWDWNGTLLDDAHLCIEVTDQQLLDLGLEPLSAETHQILFQHPVKAYYEAMGVNFENVDFEQFAARFHTRYNARRAECRVREEARVILEKLQQRGIKQSVLSAYPEEDLKEVVSLCGYTEFFYAVLGADDYQAHGKVERGLRWFQAEDIDPDQALLIGDTNHDLEAAEKMGVRCVLFPSGHQHINILRRTKADIVESLGELLEHL